MATAQQLRDAVDFLSLLSDTSRRRLEAGSKRSAYRAGSSPHRAGDPDRAFIVERGLIRIFWSDTDGRQATVAYMGSSELIGGTTIMGEQWAGGSLQAVVDTTLLMLDVGAARRAAATEIDVCAAVATHLAAQVKNALRLVAVRSLGTVSQLPSTSSNGHAASSSRQAASRRQPPTPTWRIPSVPRARWSAGR